MRAVQRGSNQSHRAPAGESRIKGLIKENRKEPKIVNTASIPQRDTDDAYGNPFLGLPANRLAAQLLADELLLDLQGREAFMPNGTDIRTLPAAFFVKRGHFFANTIDDTILASGDTNPERAVDTPHLKDDLIAGKRLFPKRNVADLNNVEAIPDGVKMHIDDVRGGIGGGRLTGANSIDVNLLGGGGASHKIDDGLLPSIDVDLLYGGGAGHKIPAGLLPNVSALGGTVPRNQIDDFLNGDRLINEGTLPLSALNGNPWAEKTTPAEVKDIVRDMVKATSLR